MLASVIGMQLSSSIIRDGSQSILIFAGEIDLATVPECSDMLTKFVDEHAGSDLAVDMRQVTALDAHAPPVRILHLLLMTNTCASDSVSNFSINTKWPALKHVLKCRPIVVLIGGIRRGIRRGIRKGIRRLALFHFCCGVRVDRGLAFPRRVQVAHC
jgi:hypothetical protein